MKKQTHYKLTVTADYFSVSNRGSASSRLWSSYDDVNRFKLANTSSIVVLHKIHNYMNYSFMDWVLCYLAFYHCGKISNINNLQGDRLILARGFRGVGTRSLGSCSWAVVRQCHGGSMLQSRDLASWQPGRGRGKMPVKSMPQWPTSSPIMPQNYNSTSGFD
jgi:hypothetical protein